MLTMTLLGAFAVWFVLESVFFAKPDIPALRARQMLSFPFGVFGGMKKDNIERILTAKKSSFVLVCGITCLLFMVVTQLYAVKSTPYLLSNSMALLTCLPTAVGILAFGKAFISFLKIKCYG